MTTGKTALVARCARTLSGDRSALAEDALNIPALAHIADDHGITALLWSALDGADGPQREIRTALDGFVRGAVTRDLLVQREMQTVLRALHEADVPAVVIKGSGLAYTIYQSPWLRPRTDTDLLVPTERIAAASAALEACGYQRCDAISTGDVVSHQVAFERTDAHGLYHVVDVHWKIANPQVVADALPFAFLWESSQPEVALGPHARVPSTVGSIVLACVHRLAHHQGHDRLIWLYDLKLLAERLDPAGWSALRNLAIAKGVAGLCLDGLNETRSRLGGPLPAEVEAALSTAADGEPSRVYLDGRVSKRDVLVSDLKLLGTWRDRLKLLREHAFPPAAFIRQRYHTTARWLLPAFYVHRLVTGAVKWVRP